MMTDVIKSKWDEFREKVLNARTQRSNDQFTKVNGARERSISILQRRYGYTREQAIYQLDKYYSRAWLG
jgi:uncharacterized protein YjbJ (UPF0337 family)